MSPVTLRRYRAERLLRRDFHALRERVLAGVRANLGARRIVLDTADLEECYAQAWQGLYTALLEGQQIENPAGWLAKVCYRRAIDEYRTRRPEQRGIDGETPGVLQGHVEPDLAGALDDRVKLRQTFEGLRQCLSKREQQAAALCYLQGLSREQAAARMGISAARMRKLMEGQGSARPGVAAKVDELLRTVAGGGWCEQQASLMRGFAYGVHDPDGERYRLARLHQRECPACRAYVISLRGLAAVLPPLVLPLGSGGVAGLGGAFGGGAAVGGGAGGSVPLGSLGVKLAAGCALALGVGGGCVVLVSGLPQRHSPAHALHRQAPVLRGQAGVPGAQGIAAVTPNSPGGRVSHSPRSAAASAHAHVGVVGAAQRELGFERPPQPTAYPTAQAARAAASHARPPLSPSKTSAAPPSATAPERGARSEFGIG